MKKISLERLLEESGTESYPEQYRYVCGLVEGRRIAPVKSAQRNGKKPALHLSYWILEEAPDYGEETWELQFRTVPAIRTDYYLKHPEVYREERRWVRLLNSFLLEQSGREAQDPYVSLNERSFQIWGREKFLQREQGKRILAHCGVELERLRVYGTAEPLAYFSHSRRTPQAVLILENKDTFYTMRRYLSEGEGRKPMCRDLPEERAPRRMFGAEIGTVVYGAGKGILRSFEDFRFCVEPHINHPDNDILYFGDLDYEGIGIYERLAELFSPEGGDSGACGHEIKPFVQAYERMLEKAWERGTDFLPETSENQNRQLSGRFFRYFSGRAEERMRQVLEAGRYIPQEIINISDFT